MMLTLLIMLIIVIPAPVMLRHMLSGRNAYRGVLEGSLSAMTGVAALFLLYWIMTGETFFDTLNSALSRISVEDMNMNAYTLMGAKPLGADEMQLMLDNMKETTKLAIPGLLIIFCMIIAYVNYAVLSWALAKRVKRVSSLPPFRSFSLPKNSVIGSLVIYLLAYLTVDMGIIDQKLIMFNLEMLFTFVFSVQGLAVVFYFGYRKRIPKLVVAVIAGIFYLTWFGQTFLFFLGLVDVVFDIRKRFSQTNLKI